MQIETIAPHLQGKLCYLATPFTVRCTDAKGKYDAGAGTAAAHDAAMWQGYLASIGISSISPIVIAHTPIERFRNGLAMYTNEAGGISPLHADLDPLDHSFWMNFCAPIQAACTCVIVPPILGREKSSGIKAEVEIAQKREQPVYWLDAPARKADECQLPQSQNKHI